LKTAQPPDKGGEEDSELNEDNRGRGVVAAPKGTTTRAVCDGREERTGEDTSSIEPVSNRQTEAHAKHKQRHTTVFYCRGTVRLVTRD